MLFVGLSSHIASLQSQSESPSPAEASCPESTLNWLAKKRGTISKSETIPLPPQGEKRKEGHIRKEGGERNRRLPNHGHPKGKPSGTQSPRHSQNRREVEPSKEEDVASISKGLGTCLSLVPCGWGEWNDRNVCEKRIKRGLLQPSG